jgi:hypothetical protein
MNSVLVEQQQLDAIIQQLGDRAQVEVLETISYRDQQFPIYSIALGSQRDDVPVIAYFGGVHGLEKIGTEVLLAYLQTLANLLDWDQELNRRLENARLLFVPIINPVGVFYGTRCNGNGVDLMRNAPIEGVGKTKLYSGHRISPRLPWYRGEQAVMEAEAQALCQVVRQQLQRSTLLIAVDLHSGFGIQDRLWFPYASRKTPFPSLAEAHALKALFDQCYPHHFYKIEPMSQEYVISGDLWDYLYDEFWQHNQQTDHFMPLTLEMGSWQWLRKNPMHLFLRHGLFHPVLPHRQQRILRRHLTLFDFLFRAALYPEKWTDLSQQQRQHHHQNGLENWYV